MKTITETELNEIYDNIVHVITSELKEKSFFPSHIYLLGYSKGVKGDKGLNGWTVVFGAMDSDKKNISELPWDLLQKIEQRIVSEIQEVSRVLYEIPHK